MKNQEKSQAGLEKLREIITIIEVAMLSTCDSMGDVWSRPMFTIHVDEEINIWFFTDRNSPKVKEMQDDSSVNISYSDYRDHTYLSVTGEAKLIEDPALKKKLWDPVLENWFPNGIDNDNVQLLKIAVKSAEYWNAERAEMESLTNNALPG